MRPLSSTVNAFIATAIASSKGASSHALPPIPSPPLHNCSYNPRYLFNTSKNFFIHTNDTPAPPLSPSSLPELNIKKERSPPFSNTSTELCDNECLLNWQICYERYCCPVAVLPSMYDGSFDKGHGMDRIRDVLKKGRRGDECYRKGVGKDDCPDGMVLVCYWFDHVGVDAYCMTIKEPGGERTNFYIGGDEVFDNYRWWALEANADHLTPSPTPEETSSASTSSTLSSWNELIHRSTLSCTTDHDNPWGKCIEFFCCPSDFTSDWPEFSMRAFFKAWAYSLPKCIAVWNNGDKIVEERRMDDMLLQCWWDDVIVKGCWWKDEEVPQGWCFTWQLYDGDYNTFGYIREKK